MTGIAQGEAAAAAALDQALAIYRRLADALADRVARLEGRGDALDADGASLLKLHQTALMTVLSFELQIHKRAGVASAADGAALDIDAARAEVARRLHRLAGRDDS